ncbi:MAG: Tetratricopeptide repeat-containing protein, partial [Verrucomicrobiaceae bacterium]|nr:Tetratricopeptide repeat-containing protein [Verrucomicrobiaceae bacterium]
MAVPLPALYLSAIDEEVHTSREEVAAALKAMGCDVISVVHAELLPQPPELRMKSLRQVNKAVLAGLMKSAAMIQLVGQSEGRMPPLPGKKNSGLGALAMEARYMKAFRRPVYYIVLGDSYPVDRAGGLPAQDAAYRRQVAALPADVYHSGSLGETLQIVHGLKDLLLKAAERQRRKAKLPALLLKISSGLLVLSQLLFFMDARWEREAAEKAARAKYDQACKEVAAVVMKEVTSPLPRWETEAGVRYEHLVKRVAYQHLFHEQWLRYELRCQAAAALKDPASSLQAKVEALHGAGFFLPGKDFAEPASGKAQQQDGVQNVQEVQVWIAAAKFCLDSGNAPEAEMHAVTALSLADRESDFATWAAARHEMGRVLLFQGQDEKGLELFQELVLQRT